MLVYWWSVMFLMSPVKLCIGGLRQIAVSLVTYEVHILNKHGVEICHGCIDFNSEAHTGCILHTDRVTNIILT